MAISGHEQVAHDVSGIINQRIAEKVSFLRQVDEAVKDHHDKKFISYWIINVMLRRLNIGNKNPITKA